MRQIPESDWKKLRNIRNAALQRQCQKSLNEWVHLIQEKKEQPTPHEIYLKVYQKIHIDNKIIVRDFDDWRRSNAFMHLLDWMAAGVITKEEFESLSEEIRAVLTMICEQIRFFNKAEKLR